MKLDKIETEECKTDNTYTLQDLINDKVNKCDIYLSKIEEDLKVIHRNIDMEDSKLDDANSNRNTNHLQIIANIGKRVIASVDSLFFNMSSIESVLSPITKEYTLKDDSFIDRTQIGYQSGYLHIRYPVLLPKKIKTGYHAGINIDRIKSTYVAAITEYFKDKKIEEYEEKVVLCIIHHYPSEFYVRDHDNYSLREIINCLCTFLFKDDNAKWLAHYQDYIVDGYEYSEIYIIPSAEFPDFLTNIKLPG